MDLLLIGKFIAEQRKLKKLTQVQLAEKLMVSEKTISKWECGKGFPDTTLILPLCKELDLTANELLSGKRLNNEEYKTRAEDNLIKLVAERKESKKKIVVSFLVVLISLLSSLTLILLSGFVDMPLATKIILICISLVIIILGIGIACVVENGAGAFECKHCGHRFVPSMKEYVLAPHTITTRRLKCPKCGKKSYCKKRLTK